MSTAHYYISMTGKIIFLILFVLPLAIIGAPLILIGKLLIIIAYELTGLLDS